ncbi:MAG: OB-fold domain-containing protein [Candidatus Accumulibacter sp.]|jgi:uncharacterized OB-fold protein|nr:OB-fold domain-containing protein [Accumulibacter sp.]
MKLAENQLIFKEGIIVFPDDPSGEPYLAVSKCPRCGKVYFPKKDFCPTCMVEEMEDAALSNEGVLYTYTIVHLGVRGFKTPYVLGWIEFPEEKVRLAAQIVTDPIEAPRTLKPRQRVKLDIGVLRSLEDGTEIVGYRYRPVE